MSFDEFLEDLGLTEHQYHLGLSVYFKGRGVHVLLKRDPCDVFTNNYNPKLLELQQANIDLIFVADEYRKFFFY
jgi:hypothetical protein